MLHSWSKGWISITLSSLYAVGLVGTHLSSGPCYSCPVFGRTSSSRNVAIPRSTQQVQSQYSSMHHTTECNMGGMRVIHKHTQQWLIPVRDSGSLFTLFWAMLNKHVGWCSNPNTLIPLLYRVIISSRCNLFSIHCPRRFLEMYPEFWRTCSMNACQY